MLLNVRHDFRVVVKRGRTIAGSFPNIDSIRCVGRRARQNSGLLGLCILEKGKPVARLGRKAMGPEHIGIARLPKGCWSLEPCYWATGGQHSLTIEARRHVLLF